ncbi:uncharacterized protein C2845_PM13G01310 [Panicum miliaceum]|uniref:Uncharacterized protein n=1 Tax=Panicum miliaceum TaxID=4540 RepID=A0A3L6RFP5_PANMI|nr:uncharacterized protein C2845_PM13G01310 [Panicum miliaceum]
MGSCASKSSCCRSAVACRVLMRAAAATSPAAVHPWTPPPEVPPGQRVTVRMRASEFRALAAAGGRAAPGAGAEDDDNGVVGRLILDDCAAGRWAWSPAPE